MAKKSRKAAKARARPAPLVKVDQQAVELRPAGLMETANAWIESVWERLVQFAQGVWAATKQVATLARDVGRLAYLWLFGSEEEFAQARLRFKLCYLRVDLDPNELAAAFAKSLNAAQ
jgi:hypothetical protein